MIARVGGVGIAELVVAGLLTVGGIRSFVVWIRRPIDSDDIRDQLSYALYRTGRIGLWFAIAFMFLLPTLIGREGRAYSEEFTRFRWYIFVPLLLAVMQFAGAYLLGRSADKRPSGKRPPVSKTRED